MNEKLATSLFVLVLSTASVAACGSGGPNDPSSGGGSSSSSGGTSSSSGGSSSGGSSSGEPGNCAASCESRATLTVDESNDGARLEGAIFEVCRAADCVSGVLAKTDAGTGYQLTLARGTDGGPVEVYAQVTPAPAAGSLRLRITWSLGFGTASGLEGETYSVSARVSEKGQELFRRTFTAKYGSETVCGTTCQVFEAGP